MKHITSCQTAFDKVTFNIFRTCQGGIVKKGRRISGAVLCAFLFLMLFCLTGAESV